MRAVEAERPLDGPGSEDESTAARPVQRQVVRRRSVSVVGAVLEEVGRNRVGAAREAELAGRAHRVVRGFVPFVAENAAGQRRRLTGLEVRDVRVTPEAKSRGLLG